MIITIKDEYDSDIFDDYEVLSNCNTPVLSPVVTALDSDNMDVSSILSQSSVTLQTPLDQLKPSQPTSPVNESKRIVSTQHTVVNSIIAADDDWIDIIIIVVTKMLQLYKVYHDSCKARFLTYKQNKVLHIVPILLVFSMLCAVPMCVVTVDRRWNQSVAPVLSQQLNDAQQQIQVCMT